LPNELISTILANISVQELIRLRVVCTRWLALIEALCQLNRSLFLTSKNCFSAFGQYLLDLSCFTRIELKRDQEDSPATLSPYFCPTLMKLFPNIQRLYIETKTGADAFSTTSLFTLLDQWQSQLTTLVLSIRLARSEAADLWRRIN